MNKIWLSIYFSLTFMLVDCSSSCKTLGLTDYTPINENKYSLWLIQFKFWTHLNSEVNIRNRKFEMLISNVINQVKCGSTRLYLSLGMRGGMKRRVGTSPLPLSCGWNKIPAEMNQSFTAVLGAVISWIQPQQIQCAFIFNLLIISTSSKPASVTIRVWLSLLPLDVWLFAGPLFHQRCEWLVRRLGWWEEACATSLTDTRTRVYSHSSTDLQRSTTTSFL